MCSGLEEGSYVRLVDSVSLDSRLESNKEKRSTFAAGESPAKREARPLMFCL